VRQIILKGMNTISRNVKIAAALVVLYALTVIGMMVVFGLVLPLAMFTAGFALLCVGTVMLSWATSDQPY
jgi:hypothetical protein